jgi:hypothetical protein
MFTPQVRSSACSLRNVVNPGVPKPRASKLIDALSITLRELPARPAGLVSCVACLQESPGKIALRPFALRTLQRFRESLFHAPGRELEMRLFWREALATACFARVLARSLSLDATLLTGGALLHRLGEVLALRLLADAEFRSGQRFFGSMMSELAAARDASLVARAISEWTLAGALRDLLLQWREDHSATSSSESARLLAVAQLLGFERVHGEHGTPLVAEAACEELHFPRSILDQARALGAGIEQLLLRAAPQMGPLAVAPVFAVAIPASQPC